MGSSASKVGLLPEPSSKGGYFSFMKSVVSYNKNKDFDEDLKKQKRAAHLWSRTQGPVSDGDATRTRQVNKAEVKFRTKFDPRVTARYDIKALIGRGSFSHVVRVEHRHTRQPFAIKLLEVKGHEGRESCRMELGVLRRVRHANVIRLAEVFETPYRVYLVLELATGGELLERVVARGSFTEADATRALIMVTSGLCYIHALGIIHRDLKPENLLYYHPGHDSRLIITDFGLACWDSKSHTLGRGDMTAGGSCGAGSVREIVDCARSHMDDDRGAGGARSCGIINIKGKDEIDDCRRLVDDGKARESSQGWGVTIGGDERGDANGCPVSTGDEREIDESLGFDGTGKDSSSVENEGDCGTALSGATKRGWLEESQTDGLETSKHTILDMVGEKEDRVGQERQSPFSNHKLKARRQTSCIERRQRRDHNNWEKSFPAEISECQNGRDWTLRTLCGTPEYLAPEMVGGRPYNSAVDMWALGVISYILLSGSMPFDQRSRPRLFKAIVRGSYSFHGEQVKYCREFKPWSFVSNQAKDFIERLLVLNPEQRMTAEQALKHPWLVTMAASSSNRNLHRPISQNLRQRASRASARSNSSSGSARGSRCATSHRSHSRSCQLGENRLQRGVMVSA
ncbi:hypothetical protein NFI96_030068 [Prochilodus magdalenae]|nr:hypothetical protein NFI96_030068 [Prochilodus magdalenae]